LTDLNKLHKTAQESS